MLNVDVLTVNGYIEPSGRYEFISIYDVMDHLKSYNEGVEFLVHLRTLSPKLIHVRFHPYQSRYGGHPANNLAYWHLVAGECSRATLYFESPSESYRSMLADAGYIIISEYPNRDVPEPQFEALAATHKEIDLAFVDYFVRPS